MIVHVKLKVNGSPEKKELFYKALMEIDTDWPYAGYTGQRVKTYECLKCGGKVYNNPKLSAGDIKRLGKQFGVNVTIRHYALVYKCEDDNKRSHYSVPEVSGKKAFVSVDHDDSGMISSYGNHKKQPFRPDAMAVYGL